MKYEILIRPEAEFEIEQAYSWYEKQRISLGVDFLLCVEEGLAKIKRSPQTYPIAYRKVRRILVRRFPYGIFYFIDGDLVVVIPVFHSHRDPMQWKSRIM